MSSRVVVPFASLYQTHHNRQCEYASLSSALSPGVALAPRPPLSSGMRQMQPTCRLQGPGIGGSEIRDTGFRGLRCDRNRLLDTANPLPFLKNPPFEAVTAHCQLSVGEWEWRGREGQQAAATALEKAENIFIFKGLKPTFLHSSNLPDYVDVERWP